MMFKLGYSPRAAYVSKVEDDEGIEQLFKKLKTRLNYCLTMGDYEAVRF